jgi:hypothetical protein
MKKISIGRLLSAITLAALFFVCLSPEFGPIVSGAFSAGIITTLFLPMPANVLGLNNTNNGTARDSYNHAKRMFFRAFRDKFPSGSVTEDARGDSMCQQFVDSLKLSQSEIRLEVLLDANNSIFTFGVTPNQANTNNQQFNTERRLVLQDSICVNEYAIFVAKPASNTDTEYLLRTYGNTQDFTAAAAISIDGGFYSNGAFQLKVNNDVVMPYRALLNHWYKGQTQQTAALGAASPGDQIRGAEDGAITDEPNIVLIGSKNNIPQIQLVQKLGTVDEFTRAILVMRGIYAQNSTVVS